MYPPTEAPHLTGRRVEFGFQTISDTEEEALCISPCLFDYGIWDSSSYNYDPGRN